MPSKLAVAVFGVGCTGLFAGGIWAGLASAKKYQAMLEKEDAEPPKPTNRVQNTKQLSPRDIQIQRILEHRKQEKVTGRSTVSDAAQLQAVRVAWRALMYGTVVAVVGCGALAAGAMFAFDIRTVADFEDRVRSLLVPGWKRIGEAMVPDALPRTPAGLGDEDEDIGDAEFQEVLRQLQEPLPPKQR